MSVQMSSSSSSSSSPWCVLDVNCGLGGVSRGFKENGFADVKAVDASSTAIEIGRGLGFLQQDAKLLTATWQPPASHVVVVSGGDVELLSRIACLGSAVAFIVEGLDVHSATFNSCRSLVELAGYDSVVFHADASFFSVPISRDRCYWVGIRGDPGGRLLESFLRRLRGEQSRLPFGVRSSGFYFRNRCDCYFFAAKAGAPLASVHSSHLPVPDLSTRDISRPRENYRRQLFDAAPVDRAMSIGIADITEMYFGGTSFTVESMAEQDLLKMIDRTMPVMLAGAFARSLLPELQQQEQQRQEQQQQQQQQVRQQRASTRFEDGIVAVIEDRANRVQRFVGEHGDRGECQMMRSLVTRANGTRVMKAVAPFGCGVCSGLSDEIVGTVLPDGWTLEIRERKNNQFRKDDLYIRSPPGPNAVVLRSRLALQRFLQ